MIQFEKKTHTAKQNIHWFEQRNPSYWIEMYCENVIHPTNICLRDVFFLLLNVRRFVRCDIFICGLCRFMCRWVLFTMYRSFLFLLLLFFVYFNCKFHDTWESLNNVIVIDEISIRWHIWCFAFVSTTNVFRAR